MLSIGNKKYRNLQEQVGFNTEQIEKIFETLDGINVQDNLVKITSSSGVLNADEMEIVSREVAFIEYNANLYIKSETTVSEFVFKQVALNVSDQGTYDILQSFRIIVTRASGAYAYSANNVLSLYNKAEMDSLLGAKANSADLALKADLSGANFTGPITSPSIIQTMVGYGYTPSSPAFTPAYVGASQTGNKLTIVLAGTLNVPDNTQIYTLGIFAIPESVGNKLYPITASQIAFLAPYAFINYISKVQVFGIINKNASNSIDVRIYASGLTVNTDYYIRIEQTFLLSDNLAS